MFDCRRQMCRQWFYRTENIVIEIELNMNFIQTIAKKMAIGILIAIRWVTNFASFWLKNEKNWLIIKASLTMQSCDTKMLRTLIFSHKFDAH